MKKKSSALSRVFEVFIFLFLYAPIVILIIFSFNEARSRTVWKGFTFDWYLKLFQNESILSALSTTLLISVIAAIISTVVGTFTAVGLYSIKKRPRDAILAVNNIPVMNADIITGVSLSLLFVSSFSIIQRVFGINLELGFVTLLIAHITFNVPYVILNVLPKLRQLDKNLFEAAQDLGATWSQAFFKVILPEIRPGIVNGLIMAFTLSIDDFVISYFTAGSNVQTLSMAIYAMTKKKISPEINALSTIMFLTVLILLIVINVREAKQEKALEKSLRASNDSH